MHPRVENHKVAVRTQFICDSHGSFHPVHVHMYMLNHCDRRNQFSNRNQSSISFNLNQFIGNIVLQIKLNIDSSHIFNK